MKHKSLLPINRVRWGSAMAVLFVAGMALLVLLLALQEGVSPVGAQGPDGEEVYYVAPDGDCGSVSPCFDSVQAAVNAVDDPGDVVKVASGVYTGVQTIGGNDQLVYLSKTLTLRGGYTTVNWDTSDPEAHPTTLDAEDQGRVIFITGAITPTIEGFSIIGGDATNLGGGPSVTPEDAGGGIYNYNGSPTLRHNRICSNTSSVDVTGHLGGGFYSFSGNPLLEANEICANSSWQGGGVYNREGNPILRGNDIYSNTVSGGGSFGGGVCNYDGDPLIEANAIYNNAAGNTSTDYGGGILNWYGDPIIQNNLIYDNSAGNGGGLANDNGAPQVWNNTIVRNKTTAPAGQGGGIFNYAGAMVISNTIIVSNTAGTGGGIFDSSGGALTLDYNDVWSNTGGNYSGVSAGANDISADPNFVDYAGDDFYLAAGSLCIDAGDPDTTLASDKDGRVRPFNGYYDLGAYEWYGGSCFVRLNDGAIYDSVQAAVDASASSSDVVKVAGVCRGAAGRVSLSKNLTLRGGYTLTNWLEPAPGAAVILDAQGAGRVITVTGSVTSVIEGLHLTGGSITGSGGGIHVGSGATPAVRNCVIYTNTATANGGGIHITDGAGTFWNNTLYGNTAANGGGIYVNSGAAVIHNNVIVHNSSGLHDAGGLAGADYNDVWSNGGTNYGGSASAGAHDISADPLFADAGGEDFHLTLLSPCIDRGDPATALDGDFEGHDRPLGYGYDLGADESTEYLGVTLEPDQNVGADPDTVVVLIHRLTNVGTVADVYDLTHQDEQGWVVSYTTPVTVAGETWQDIAIQVSVPDGTPAGTLNTLVLTATSGLNPLVQDPVTDTLVVAQAPAAEFQPDHDEDADPGQVLTFTHFLTNTGNAPDSFTISVDNSRHWAGILVTQTGQLAINQAVTVQITVSIPYTAAGGLVDVTRVIAASQAVPTITAVATDTISVNATLGTRYVSQSGTDQDNNCTSGGYPCASVRHALEQATTGDAILVAAGTYADHDVIINENVTLQGGYSADFSVWDPDIFVTTLDAQGQGRVLYVTGSGLTPLIEGLRIVNGSTRGNGGGIYIDGWAAPTLRQNTFSNNQADNDGGAIYTMYGDPQLQDNTLVNNSANNGGAIYNLGGDLLLEGERFERNSAVTNGGALYNKNGALTLKANHIYSNTAVSGAGLYNGPGQITLHNNLFYGNVASGEGGGIRVDAGQATIWNNTLHNNTAGAGGGIYAAGASLVISNTILASNAGGGVYANGGTASLDYNDVWNNSGGDYLGVTPGPHSISADPLFMDPGSHDLRLQAASPCVDTGDPNTTLLEDFEEDIRPAFYGFDIGADELSGCYARLDGVIYGSLQRAVDLAYDGALIDISGTCWGVAPVDVEEGTVWQTVYIPWSLDLRGGWDSAFETWSPGAYPTTIDPMGLGRAFYIHGAVAVTMEDLQIVNGNAAGQGGGPGWADAGGAIYNAQGTLQLASCNIYNSQAVYGGGLYDGSGDLWLGGCRVHDNIATSAGGGIYNSAGELTLQGGTVATNTATTGSGGGVYHAGVGLTVNGAGVHGNTAGDDGGGLYHAGAGLTVNGAGVHDNTAGGDGGGLFYHSTADLSLMDNGFYDNEALRGGGVFIHAGLAVMRPALTMDPAALAAWSSEVGRDVISINDAVLGTALHVGRDAISTHVSRDAISTIPGDIQGFIPQEPHSSLLAQNNRFYDNLASDGGGIYCESGHPTFRNNFVYRNQVSNDGGGFYLGSCLALVEHNTLYGNDASHYGGGIYNSSNSSAIHSNIVMNGIAGDGGGIYEAGSADLDYNDVWNNDGGNYGGGTSGGPNSISEDPLLVNPLEGDFHLSVAPLSPCFDTADPASALLVDFEGDIRPSHQGFDIGADEIGGCLARLNGVIYGSLQRAVDLANTGEIIDVAGICMGVNERNVASQDIRQNLYLDKAITIQGGWALDFSEHDVLWYPTTLDALGWGRVVYINVAGKPWLLDFWLENGDATGLGGGPGDADAGGGIYNNGSSAYVGDDVLRYNDGGGYGGGVYNHNGDMTLTGYVVAANTADFGAGFYSDGGAPRLINNGFAEGVAANDGGAIYIAGGSPTLWNQVVTENEAGNNGGGIYLAGGSVEIWNLTVDGNTAGNNGGGIYNAGATVSLRNTIVSSNTADATGGGIFNTGAMTLDYNDVWNNNALADPDYHGAFAGPHSISADPLLFFWYWIPADSPCRDTGDPNTPPDLDFDIDLQIRPSHQGYDMGAYEYDFCHVRNHNTNEYYGSLQLAVDEASAGNQLDVAGTCLGVHPLDTPGGTIFQNLHLLKTVDILGGWRITLEGWEWSPSGTSVLDAEGGGRVVYIGDGVTPSVSNMTLRNGDATNLGGGPGGRDAGGGVFNGNGTPSFTNSRFEVNNADAGGGFYNDSGTTTLTNCLVISNTATDGAGLFNNVGSLEASYNSFERNVASNQGGGVYNSSGSPLLWVNEFFSNTAAAGGGIYNQSGAPTIQNTIIYNNQASSDGGGIYNAGGNALVGNNTLYNNTAGGAGGGVYSVNGSPIIVNTILMSNTAAHGGGVYNSGTTLFLDYNDVYTNAGGDYDGVVTIGSHNISADPDFVNAAMADFHLRDYWSPAVDAGAPGTTLAVDFEGDIRPSHQGFDIGVDELGGCLAELNGQIYGSVQLAVDASQDPGDVVKVSGICYGVHPLLVGSDVISQHLHLSKTLTVQGGWNSNFSAWDPESCPSTLDALGRGRVVYVTGPVSVTLSYLNLVNGAAVGLGGGPGGLDAGGGVHNNSISLTLQANAIYSNTAALGGGIYLHQGTGVWQNNLVYRNQASDSGAGIYVYDGAAVIEHNTIYHNVAANQGGGIYNHNGQTAITNTIVASNTAATGGGIYQDPAGNIASLDYNDVWSNSGGDYANLASGPHSFSADPLFVDGPAGDFHLTAESPAINTGDPTSTVAQDYDGETRPSGLGYDVGADEFAVEAAVTLEPDYQRSLDPGDVTEYNHTLTNGGNYTDVFAITFNSSQGWAEMLTTTPITLGPGGTAPVNMRVTVPPAATSDMQDTTVVRATSILNGVSDTATDETSINLNPQVEIGPPGYDRALPGQTVIYNHVVTNTGNGPDTFDLTFKSDYSWVTLVTSPTISLEKDETAAVQITVTILSWPAGGLTDVAYVIVTSQSDPLVSAAVADSTYISYTTGARHVAAGGDDTANNCTDPGYAPCATTQHAVNQAAAGDPIKVAQGSYTDVHTATVEGGVVTQTLFLTKSVNLQGGYLTTDWLVPLPRARSTVLNPAGQGRAIYITGTITPTVAGFVIQGGQAEMGGGVYIASGEPTLAANEIWNNTAGRGAGVYDAGDGTIAQNNVLHGNTATGEGGGLYAAGSLLVENNTIYANTAITGGGLYLAAGTPTIYNTIVAQNSATSGGGIYAAAGTPTLDYNDVWNNTGGNYAGVSAGTHSISADPLLTADFHLVEGSPCMDTGNPATTLAVDFEGDFRPTHQGFDIGADELGGCYVRLNGTDYGVVQDAVDASASTDDVVMVSGLCQGVHLVWDGSDWISQTVHLTKTLRLQGGWDQDFTTWDPQAQPTWLDALGRGRVIYISGAVTPTIEGFSIVGGEAAGLGGGPAGQDAGGGFYHNSGAAILLANTIYSNTAQFGAGFYSAAGAPTLQNNVIRDNEANEDGGGIYLHDGAALMEHNTIVRNVAQNAGGGLSSSSGTAVLRSSIVVSNTAAAGGGVHGAVTLSHNDVWHNPGGDYDGPTPDASSISEDPQFVDPAGNDFHLPGGSPCVDTGDPATALAVDFEGDFRPQGPGYDMGADEFLHQVALSFYADEAAAADPGETVIYTHTLVNQGNYQDTFDLTISGWGALATATPIILTSGQAAEVVVTVDVPVDAAGGVVDTTVVTATSQANSSVRGAVVDQTTVNTIAGLLFAPDRGRTVNSDQIITYTHTLTNTGNTTDNFYFSYTRSRGWPVDYTPRPFITLGSGMTTTVVVSITAPPNSSGLTEIVTLTATSALSPTVWDSVVDTMIVFDVCPHPLTGVEITGETGGAPGVYAFGVITTPLDATLPITYLWDNGETTPVSLRALGVGTYTLAVTATNCGGPVTDTHVIVIHPNNPPYTPSNPTPPDGATGVSLNPVLSWQGGDPDGQTVTYTVAFGPTDPPPIVAVVTDPLWIPGSLPAHTIHYWAITATDGMSVTAGPVWSFTTLNHAPNIPSDPIPYDGEVGVTITVTLSWSGGDPDGDPVTYTVTFSDVTDIVTVSSWNPGSLLPGTTYSWTITATDGISLAAGPRWHFTTIITGANLAPAAPTHPHPSDGAAGVPLTPTLTWQCSDPNGDVLTYTVGFGVCGQPLVSTAGVTTTSYDPGELQFDTAYCWIITATDGLSVTVGDRWSFTTTVPITNAPPYEPSNPVPADGTVNVPLDQMLYWQGGDPDDDPVSYVVAFGTADPPPVVATATATHWDPGPLQTNVTYYWAITASDGISDTAGPVWSFTTLGGPNNPPYTPSNPDPAFQELDVALRPTLSWDGGDPDGDLVTYTVEFGTSFPMPRAAVVTTTHWAVLDPLETETWYYWRIRASDGLAVATGSVWRFKTGAGERIFLPIVLRNAP